jgi:hypothetical protein
VRLDRRPTNGRNSKIGWTFRRYSSICGAEVPQGRLITNRAASIGANKKRGATMPDMASRLVAFFAVAFALLGSGVFFQRGEMVPTLYFMIGAILLTIVTHLNVRRNNI